MDVAEHLDALTEQGRLLADAAGRARLDAAVPTCPEWTTRDLVRHTGAVHRWAAHHVRDALPEMIRELEHVVDGWPPDGELVAWFRDGHTDLVEVLRAAPPDLDCATFLAAPSPLAMWARRQAHETTVHRIDAELTAGTAVTPVPASLAADGIDELLTCYIARPRRGPRRDPAYRMSVQPTDVDVAWSLTVSDADVEVARTGGGATAAADRSGADGAEADGSAAIADEVVVTGPAERLYTLLWNRSDTTGVTVSGDTTLLDHWSEHALR